MSLKRKPFFIRELRGVNQYYIKKLQEVGIKYSDQMLLAGQTEEKRAALAKQLGIPT
jgi:hypothetical protein